MRENRKIVLVLLIVTLVLGFKCGTVTVEAKKWTKKMIETEIAKTKPQLDRAKANYNALKKKKKGTKLLFLSKLISTDPLIVYDSLSGSYYWIESGKKNLAITTATGWVSGNIKTTGDYREYGWITCAVARGVKVSSDLNKASKKYTKLKNKYNGLKNSLKDTPYLDFSSSDNYDSNYDELNVSLGQKTNLKKYLKFKKNSGTYSKSNLRYSSSNKKIATVDKNGFLKTHGEGSVTIIVKSNISGKRSKNSVYVMNDFSVGDTRNLYTPLDGYEEEGYIQLRKGETDRLTYSFVSNKTHPVMTFTSSDPSIVSVDSEGNIIALNTGAVDIKMGTDYVYTKVAVIVKEE